MSLPFAFTLVTFLISWTSVETDGYIIGSNPHHRAEYLDTQGLYYLEWRVDLPQNRITFNITAGTTGYVLFGLANNGSATTGADIIVGGVLPYGEPYFSDGYTLGPETPREDHTTKDYQLLGAWENDTHTTLSFSRPLDTCDHLDYPLSTDNVVTVIWGYGVTDDFQVSRKYGVEGSYSVYLLDPDYTPRISRDRRLNGAPTVVTRENLKVWSVRRQIVIPNNDTSYICSVHKAPPLPHKHHVVGHDIYFHSQGSRRRVHHLLIYRCNLPRGQDTRAMFEPLVDGPGQTCFIPNRGPAPGDPIQTQFCTELYVGWAIGGRAFFSAPHVGIPLGEREDEYFMYQIHYDNPDRLSGLVVDMRIDLFYTSFLRPYDGGMLGFGLENPALPPTLIVPPRTEGERIFQHCAPECTRRMFPESGINIYGALLHSHVAGRKLRLRHFSADRTQELPWVLYDDNYSNGFQNMRALKKEVKVLRGEQLTMECAYNSDNRTVVGGYRTSQEMCIAFLMYYPRISDYSFCQGGIVSEEYRRRFFGVSNVTFNEDVLDWVAVTPPHLAGLTISQISDNYVNWNEGLRQELRRFHEAHPQVSKCSKHLSVRDPAQVRALQASGPGELTGALPTNVNTPDDYVGPGTYPFRARPYVPENTCSFYK